MRLPTLSTLALLAAACGGSSPADVDAGPADAGPVADAAAPDAAPVPEAIEDFLATIPGLGYEELATDYPGYRLFYLALEQPLDHAQPGGRTFVQRMMLHHRGRERPMILYTSGYSLFSDDYLSELGVALGANQISTEQRFFAGSTPEDLAPADWALVTIEQAAGDHHRIVALLEPYYGAAWLSTGHSKGGMTSIYHRRFYPQDVAATVAYVAPISFGAPDTRYYGFFDTVADAGCRAALREAQIAALERFPAMLQRAEAQAAGYGMTFTRAGGQPAAFESDIAGLHWSFWQYYGAGYCPAIPASSATDDELFDFVSTYGGIGSDDWSIALFETYYYQATVELGYPAVPTDYLDSLLVYADVEGDYLPAGVDPEYDPNAMVDIDGWVRGEGSELLLVYGEYDPWYAGAFELGDAADSFLFVAPQANHGAMLRDLPATERAAALAAIERWSGVTPELDPYFAAAVRRPELPRLPPPRRYRLAP